MTLDLATIEERLEARQPRDVAGDHVTRRAAVAAILRPGPEGPRVLLIRRAESPGDPWSGHMAFPGGRHDETDRDLLHTAVRETREEVGLDLERAGRLLGRLDDIEAIARARRTGMAIRPFVFAVEESPPLRPNYEVAETLWAPLGPLLAGEVDTVRPYEHQGRRLSLPAYDVDGRIVWGLTYQMLQAFFGLLRT